MKKLTPFIFPLIVVGIVVFLLFRWFQMRTDGVDEKLSFGEGIEIEDLSGDELNSVMLGGEQVKTVQLESNSSEPSDSYTAGVVRYEMQGERVAFSVISQLPELSEGMYQVWLREPGQETAQKAFVLEVGKGGYVGSAAVSADLLPFEVIVTKEMQDDDTMEETILQAEITAAENQEGAE